MKMKMKIKITPLAILFVAAIAFAFPASAIGSDDPGMVTLPVIRYDFGQKNTIPVAEGIILLQGDVKIYSYEDGSSFLLAKGIDASGKKYIAHVSYAPRLHFEEEIDLRKTREALRGYCQDNNLKADGAGAGAVTEKYRHCNEHLPDDRLAALLYPVESTV